MGGFRRASRLAKGLAALFACFIGARTDSVVVELDGAQFDGLMNDHSMLLVNFYVPWCGHSRRLEPELVEAASQLEGRVKVARVDCSKHPALAQRFHVRAHPTLKLFVSGFPVDYRRKGTADEIVAYCERMQAPPITPVDSLEAARNFVGSEELAVLAFMTQRQAEDRFSKLERIALRWRPDVAFANVQNGACDIQHGSTALRLALLRHAFDFRVNLPKVCGRQPSIVHLVPAGQAERSV